MDTVITITPSQLVAWFVGLCAAIVTVSGAVAAIMRAVNKAKEPNAKQDRRIDKLEDRIDKLEGRVDGHDELFRNDQRHFESLEAGSRVTQKAILALLDHGIDGNNEAQMRKAKDELQEHLIER